MKKLLITLTTLTAVFQLSAQYQIGHYSKTFVDPDRNNRNILTEVYYPAVTAGDNTAAVQEEFPVIIFGHGFVMAWDAYENIWEELVPKGYIIAFPRTEGNIVSTNHQQFGWDLQFLVTELQNEGNLSTSMLYQVVHPNTSLMGHSMGGGAAFLAADSLCENNNINLKTLVGLAPAESSTNGVSSIASAANITVPSLIFSGIQDGVTPPVEHHIPMYDALATNCKTILNIIGGAHCYFANSNLACDFGESTSSSGISITRVQQQDVFNDFITPWLDFTLKSNCTSFNIFQDSVAISTRITYNQQCNYVSPTINTNLSQSSSSITSLEATSGASYQWINCFDNSEIVGATTATFSPSTDGDYAVVITLNGCSATSSCVEFSTAGLGLFTAENIHLNLFPNPVNDQLNIHYSNENSIQLTITDLHGKIISTSEIKNGDSVSLKEFEQGIYLFQFQTQNSTIVERVVKQ